MKKKIISLLLLTIMTLSIIVPVYAENDSGKMGENATWNYDSSTETFTVSGIGSLYEFSDSVSPYENYFAKNIVIENGITKITSFSLWLGEYSEIHIPRSVTKIEEFAFSLANDDTQVYYTGTEEEWKKMDRGTDIYFNHAVIHYGQSSTVSKANTKQTSTTTAANKTNADVSKKATTSSNSIKVYIDNRIVSFDVQPQLIGGRTMVPLRAIFEGLGATVEWNDSTQTVTAYNETTIVKATIGEYTMNVNGTAKSIDVPPMLVNDRTLVPARFVAEAFDCDVDWDGNTQTVYITTKEIDYSKVEQSTTQKPTESKNNSLSKSDNSTTVSNKEEDTVTAVDKTQTGKSGYRVETIIEGHYDVKNEHNDAQTIQIDDKLYVRQKTSNSGKSFKVYEIDLLTGKSRLYADLANMEIDIDGETCFCTYVKLGRLLYYPKNKCLVLTGVQMAYNDVFTGKSEYMGDYMIDITNEKVFNLPSSKYDNMIELASGFNMTGDLFWHNNILPYPKYDKYTNIDKIKGTSLVYKKGKAYTCCDTIDG